MSVRIVNVGGVHGRTMVIVNGYNITPDVEAVQFELKPGQLAEPVVVLRVRAERIDVVAERVSVEPTDGDE